MKGYEVDSAPFYTSHDGSVWALKGLSKTRGGLPVVVICNELTRARHPANLIEKLNEVLNLALRHAHEEDKTLWKIIEMQIDLKAAPKAFRLFRILKFNFPEEAKETRALPSDEELQIHLQRNSVSIFGRRSAYDDKPVGSDRHELYRFDPEPFYVNSDNSVRLFKGVTEDEVPVVCKRHEFLIGIPELQEKLAAAIDIALAQARVHHSHTCKIMAVKIAVTPKSYLIEHILEQLKRDVALEIEEHQKTNTPLSETALWKFLHQTASALETAHSKVNIT